MVYMTVEHPAMQGGPLPEVTSLHATFAYMCCTAICTGRPREICLHPSCRHLPCSQLCAGQVGDILYMPRGTVHQAVAQVPHVDTCLAHTFALFRSGTFCTCPEVQSIRHQHRKKRRPISRIHWKALRNLPASLCRQLPCSQAFSHWSGWGHSVHAQRYSPSGSSSGRSVNPSHDFNLSGLLLRRAGTGCAADSPGGAGRTCLHAPCVEEGFAVGFPV